jgi:uncharacterized membrane protein
MTEPRDLEHTLGRVLTFGTRASTVTLALGLAATFLAPGHAVTPILLTTGLLVLLLTPVARVVVSFAGYLRDRDWWFVLYTGIVLGLLVAGFATAFDR